MRSRAVRDDERATFPQDSGNDPALQDANVPLAGISPDTYLLEHMKSDKDAPWHPARLAARIDARVDSLGVSRTSLLKAARVPEKAVRDLEAEHWPNLRRVAQLADAFKFPGGIAEFLGVSADQDSPCDPRILHVALELVGSVLKSQINDNPLITKPHVVAGLASVAYQQLVELRRIDPHALDNAAALHLISVMLSSELARFDSLKS